MGGVSSIYEAFVERSVYIISITYSKNSYKLTEYDIKVALPLINKKVLSL